MKLNLDDPLLIAGQLVVLMLSTSLHESAHAYTATWLGDPTPRQLGRVTLNPLPHLHWLGSILLPLIMLVFFPGQGILAAGRPVPVDVKQFRNPSRGFMLVAIAGPISNLVIAFVVTLGFVALRQGDLVDYATKSGKLTYDLFDFAIGLNLTLAILNALPIPPLDGSRFLAYLLPKTIQPWFYRIDPVGLIILILLVCTHQLEPILEQTAVPLSRWWQDVYTRWLV